jgi:hypothetical protein
MINIDEEESDVFSKDWRRPSGNTFHVPSSQQDGLSKYIFLTWTNYIEDNHLTYIFRDEFGKETN